MEKKPLDKSKKITRVIYILSALCFVFLLLFFIKAVKHRKFYDESKTHYRIFHYSNKTVNEDPIEIISQFRGDSMKKGIIPGVFSLKGQVKSLSKKINGSLHGASKATPAVDESGIYIGADDGWFYKFNQQGELMWKTYFANAENGVHGTALLSKKYLWVGAYNGVLYCLKKETGEVVWTIGLGDAIGSSPSFYNGQIIVSVELLYPRALGYVASVSARDGSLNWKSSLTSAHIHSSVAIHPEKAYGVTGANNGFLFKIDLHSGKLLWALQLKDAIKSTPLIHKDHIYVSNWGNQFAAISEEGKLIWEVYIKSRSQSSPAYVPDKGYLLFATHMIGKLFAVSAKSGAIVWEKKINHQRAIASGVSFFSAVEKKFLFLFPCDVKAICIIDPANGNFLKKIQTDFLLTGSFSSFNQRFYMNFDEGGVAVLY